ncbi:MAG: class I SAM-dependent rRNA methyltransferase [Prolixibacteraceae bacterium]|nr:class I SAM-dependent rRNA methyltransferase [Prolixibacteraceae bacterium]
MDKIIVVVLNKGREQSIKRFHPWIFSGAIKSVEGTPKEGEIVRVVSNHGEFLALGHYQVGSITIRIVSFDDVQIDHEFWKEQISKAIEVRKSLGLFYSDETNVFRLVHGEGDSLPGLIIDFYNGTAVIQSHSIGMYQLRNEFAEILHELLEEKLEAVYFKSNKSLSGRGSIAELENGFYGTDHSQSPVIVKEYGNKFNVDFIEGQKTGFFIDQRENRHLLMDFAKDRDVLNMFGYTGGFSVYALKGGAKHVDTVDASARAMELTDKNVSVNGDIDDHKSFVCDAADFMKDIKDKYDLIILDPPAFAKHRSALSQALQAYKRLNQKALEQIRPKGILFTFSCSQVVTKEKFREAVFSAAALSKRRVRILYQLTQPADHPISIYHPEGEYLKGLVLYVE